MSALITFLTSDAGMAAMGAVGGWVMRYQTEKNRLFFEVIKARDASMEAAAARTKDGGTWMRRAIFILIAFSLVSVIVAPFLGEPVIVENVVTKGILFWKRTVTEFVTIDGVLFPAEIRRAFLLLCAFYLGQGIK